MAGVVWTEEDTEKLYEQYRRLAKLKKPKYLLKSIFPGKTLGQIDYKLRQAIADKIVKPYGDYVPEKMTAKEVGEVVVDDVRIKKYSALAHNSEMKYRKVLEEKAYYDALATVIADKCTAFPAIEISVVAPAPANFDHPLQGLEESLIILWSDEHADQKIDDDMMEGMGGFDFGRFKKRAQHYTDEIIKRVEEKPVKEAHLFRLGDSLGGVIHDIAEFTQGNVVDALLMVASIEAQAYMEIASKVPSLHITSIVGNHPRMKEKRQHRAKFMNFDFLLSHFIRQFMSKQENVTHDIPKAANALVEVNGQYHYLAHGDELGMGASFAASVNSAKGIIHKYVTENGVHIRYVHMGHYHQPAMVPMASGFLYVNGSFCGTDEYAWVGLQVGTRPYQWILRADETGDIIRQDLIRLDYGDALAESRYQGDVDNTDPLAYLETAGF